MSIKPETRRPKSERRPKPEARSPKNRPVFFCFAQGLDFDGAVFRFRISDFDLLSGFGLRPSDFDPPRHAH